MNIYIIKWDCCHSEFHTCGHSLIVWRSSTGMKLIVTTISSYYIYIYIHYIYSIYQDIEHSLKSVDCFLQSYNLYIIQYRSFTQRMIIKVTWSYLVCETPSSREHLELNFYNSLYWFLYQALYMCWTQYYILVYIYMYIYEIKYNYKRSNCCVLCRQCWNTNQNIKGWCTAIIWKARSNFALCILAIHQLDNLLDL